MLGNVKEDLCVENVDYSYLLPGHKKNGEESQEHDRTEMTH